MIWFLSGVTVVATLAFATGVFLSKRLWKYGGLLVAALMIFLILKSGR